VAAIVLTMIFNRSVHEALFGHSSDKRGSYTPPSTQTQKNNDRSKTQKFANPHLNTPIDSSATGRLEISNIAQDSATGDIIVQTKLYDVTWTECTLILSMDNYKITRTADVLFSPGFSTCKGFDIKNSEIPASGIWTAALSAKQANGAVQTAPMQTVKVTAQ